MNYHTILSFHQKCSYVNDASADASILLLTCSSAHFIGTVELDLRNLTPPAKTPEKCTLGMMEVMLDAGPHKSDLTNSLFAQQSVRGWWPCVIEQDGKEVLGVSTA